MCSLICGYKPIIKDKYEGDLYGVDKGAYYLALNGFKDFYAIGDFDSVSCEEFDLIKKSTDKITRLNPIKDDTDLEHVLNYIKNNRYTDVRIYGALGGRQDHNLLNLKLIYLSDLNICAYDERNKVLNVKKGSHIINKDNYKYLSLLTFEESLIKLDGVKYPLDIVNIDINDNYTTSNEILEDTCKLDLIKGRLLVIQSND